jgi:hypothetical protein
MKRIAHHLAWLLGTAALLVSVASCAGRLARAQQPPGRFPAAPAAAPAAAPDDPDDDPKPVPQRRLVWGAGLRLDESQRQGYVQTLVGQICGEVRTEEEAAREIEAALAKRVDHLDRATGLSDLQKRKLRAAGRGDIKRFLDRVAEAKRQILSARELEELSVAFMNHSAVLQQEWAALRAAGGPIFANASRRTLTDEQRGRFEKDLRDRREYRYRAAVRWTVVMIARSLGLTDGQRRRLETVLLEETRVPENLVTYEYAIVMYQASLIPEARIRPVFDEVQWRVMSRELASFKNQERWLRAGGLIPAQLGD